jgi:hypothetical protein
VPPTHLIDDRRVTDPGRRGFRRVFGFQAVRDLADKPCQVCNVRRTEMADESTAGAGEESR